MHVYGLFFLAHQRARLKVTILAVLVVGFGVLANELIACSEALLSMQVPCGRLFADEPFGVIGVVARLNVHMGACFGKLAGELGFEALLCVHVLFQTACRIGML